MRSKLTVIILLLSIGATLSAIPLLARSIKNQSDSVQAVLGGELPGDFEYINGFVTEQGKFAQLRSKDQRVRIDIAIGAADPKCVGTSVDISKIEQSCLEPVLQRFILAQLNPKRSRQISPMTLAVGGDSVAATAFELPDQHFYWIAQRRSSADSRVLIAHTRNKSLSTEEFRQILQALQTTF